MISPKKSNFNVSALKFSGNEKNSCRYIKKKILINYFKYTFIFLLMLKYVLLLIYKFLIH